MDMDNGHSKTCDPSNTECTLDAHAWRHSAAHWDKAVKAIESEQKELRRAEAERKAQAWEDHLK